MVCSSTTTRMRKTGRRAPHTRSAHSLTRACQRHFTGMKCLTVTQPTSLCSRCPSASRKSAIRTRIWMRLLARSRNCSSSPTRTKQKVSATLPGRHTSARQKGNPLESCRRARSPLQRRRAAKKPRVKMPLIIVANSPDKRLALAGLERWKEKYAEAAKLLAVDDVLIDSMRGRSSTWTRIRINLRHVPEAIRPPQETPDPDDDPTREFRKRWQQKKRAG